MPFLSYHYKYKYMEFAADTLSRAERFVWIRLCLITVFQQRTKQLDLVLKISICGKAANCGGSVMLWAWKFISNEIFVMILCHTMFS